MGNETIVEIHFLVVTETALESIFPSWNVPRRNDSRTMSLISLLVLVGVARVLAHTIWCGGMSQNNQPHGPSVWSDSRPRGPCPTVDSHAQVTLIHWRNRESHTSTFDQCHSHPMNSIHCYCRSRWFKMCFLQNRETWIR